MANLAKSNSKKQTVPETCRGKLCDGLYLPNPDYYWEWVRCPLDGPDCPFHMQRLLRPLGFGTRYQSAKLEKINIPKVRETVASYISGITDRIAEGKGLYIQGGVGTGKTSILALVAYAAASASHTVVYWYAGELFDRLHRQDDEAMGRAHRCDLLLVDDFGVQYASDWTVTRFDALVEFRYAHEKAMCVTTNVSREELRANDVWRRVYDRWREMCEGISLGKESLR